MNMTAAQIRLWNARYLADRDGSITAFAEKLDKSLAQAGQLIGSNPIKNIGNKIAREIEKAYDKKEGWLDQARPAEWKTIHRDEWKAKLEDLNLNNIAEGQASYKANAKLLFDTENLDPEIKEQVIKIIRALEKGEISKERFLSATSLLFPE